jgi:hypothetical protein
MPPCVHNPTYVADTHLKDHQPRRRDEFEELGHDHRRAAQGSVTALGGPSTSSQSSAGTVAQTTTRSWVRHGGSYLEM